MNDIEVLGASEYCCVVSVVVDVNKLHKGTPHPLRKKQNLSQNVFGLHSIVLSTYAEYGVL